MKAHTVYKTFRVPERRVFVRITEDVRDAVDESDIREGMVLRPSSTVSSTAAAPSGSSSRSSGNRTEECT